jgi:carbon storage regulator
MLVLSRKPGQRIRIAGTIELTVLKVCGSVVKLGFTGPTNVPIHREEVYQRIEAEQAQQADCNFPQREVSVEL